MRICRITLLLCLMLTIIVGLDQPDSTSAQGGAVCPGLVPSRFQPNPENNPPDKRPETGRVVYDNDGIGVVLRDGPGKEQSGYNVVRALPEGTILTMLEGPVCADAAIWWRVQLVTGENNWVAEGDVAKYFIEPFVVSSAVVVPDVNNPRTLIHWEIDSEGDIQQRGTFTVPGGDPEKASILWQEPDIDAANEALVDRRTNCAGVLAGTPWDGVFNAGEVMVPEGEFEFYPAPDGTRVFLVRHRVVMMPACEDSPARYYGVSTVHLLTSQGISDLFPYGQHSGARSTEACLSPDVYNLQWHTYLSQVDWSPDGDTVAFTVRYLDEDASSRPCAFYYTFMVDIFSGQVASVAEGRRIGWGEGGTRLYYFTQGTDSGYNIIAETLWQLQNGQVNSIALPSGSEPLPSGFNSIGVNLPWSDDGRQILVCTEGTSCPSVFSFDIVNRQPTPAVTTPTDFQPYEIADVLYVAGNTRLLWITIYGEAFIEGLQGADSGNWARIETPGVEVTEVYVMPSGGHVVFAFNNGEYAIYDTVGFTLQNLGTLAESEVTPAATTEVTTPEATTATEATPIPEVTTAPAVTTAPEATVAPTSPPSDPNATEESN